MTHDPLRFEFVVECSELLASYSISLSEAACRSNEQSCRAYFEAIRAVARDLNKTLSEIESGAAKARMEADARHANERGGSQASGTDDAVRGNQSVGHGMAAGSRRMPGRQAAA